MTNTFDKFIKSQSQKTSSENNPHLTLEQEKELWLDNLAELYELVNKSLGDYVQSGDEIISRSPVRSIHPIHQSQSSSDDLIMYAKPPYLIRPHRLFQS